MYLSKRKIFSIVFPIFAVTIFLFLLAGCKNKNLKLRDEAITKATVFIQDNVDFGTEPKGEGDIELGRSYVVANPELKDQIKTAMNTLKAIPDDQLKKDDIDNLNKLIEKLQLINGNATFYKVTFDPNGGTSADKLEQKFKNGTKITIAPTLTYSGYKFLGWEYNGEIIDLATFTVSKDITLIAQWEKGKVYHTITLDDSVKDLISLDDPSVDLTKLEDNQIINFTITPKEHTRIKLFFGDEEQVISSDNKYSVKVVKSFTIKVEVQNITYKLTIVDEKNKLTHNITDLNNILEGTKVVLQLGEMIGYKRVLKVNNTEISETSITDNKYEFNITKNTVVELVFNKLYKLTFEQSIKDYLEIVEPAGIDLTNTNWLKLNTELKFKIKGISEDKILEKIIVGSKNLAVNSDPNYIYTLKLNEDIHINLELKTKTYKVNVNASPASCLEFLKIYKQGSLEEVDITNELEHGTKLTFKLSSTFPAGYKLTALFNDVDHSEDIKTGYNVELTQVLNISITQVSTTIKYNFSIDEQSREYIEIVSPNDINPAGVNELLKNTEVRFKLKNIPMDKIVDHISFGTTSIQVNADPNFIYTGNINNDTTLSITLKTKTYLISLNGVPNEAVNDVKVYKKGTLEELDLTKGYDHGTQITIKRIDGFSANHSLKVVYDDRDISTEVISGYDITLTKNVEIVITKTAVATTINLKLGDAKLFDAGHIGNEIHNYATKLATLNGKTIPFGGRLTFDYFFYKDNRHCFENFLIEETGKFINIGDQLPDTTLTTLTLIPQFKAGYYREDTINKVYYMYKTIATGKFELVRLGNVKKLLSDEYIACETITIPQVEYTGTGVEESYIVKSIAPNATKDLRKVKKVDLYGDNKLAIESIGDNNFNNIDTLEYFLISTKIKHIGMNTLVGCANLKKVVKDNVVYLDNDTTEQHCYLIAIGVQDKDAEEIKLHKNTRIIHHGAFNNMTKLTKVVLNKNLKQIGNDAFKECKKLQTINLNEATSLKSIGKHAFKDTLVTKEYITSNVAKGCLVDTEVC